MKTCLLSLLLALLAGDAAALDMKTSPRPKPRPARSYWLLVDSYDAASVYAQVTSVRIDNDRARISALIDYKRPQRLENGSASFLSDGFETEFDCVHNEYRTLGYTLHLANMGLGSAVASDAKVSKWEAIPAGSYVEKIANLACEPVRAPLRGAADAPVRSVKYR